jgi:uncharacterized repeat protein (TIGR03803 family)
MFPKSPMMRHKQNASFVLPLLRFAFTVAALVLAAATLVSAQSYRVLHSFSSPEGQSPNGLIVDGAGNLFGTTYDGGFLDGYCDGGGCGVVFELSPTSTAWKLTEIYQFHGPDAGDGGNPGGPFGGPLVLDKAGNLFGTTYGGGQMGGILGIGTGTFFEVSPTTTGTWQETVSMNGTFGGSFNPAGGLTSDANGHLFGSASLAGGNCSFYGCGGVFEAIQTSPKWTISEVYNPPLYATDAAEVGRPTVEPDGALYAAAEGGAFGWGCLVAFRQNSDGTWTEDILHNFRGGPDGSYGGGFFPYALTPDGHGGFYGTTDFGGKAKHGTVFKLARNSSGQWTETVIFNFGTMGKGPFGTPVLDAQGNLYGTAQGGNLACGTHGCGMLLKLTPSSNGIWTGQVVHRFSGPDGDGPNSLILDGKGHIFGTTFAGGANGSGVVFELTP